MFLAKFTEAAHFGGDDRGDGDRRDRKTVIEELISEAKLRKAERARDHEEILDMTYKLDNNWKELFPAVKELQRENNEEHVEPDEYDRLVKEMIFCPRGEPTQKLKNEEDIARMEKDRLDKLERERIQRMKGDQDEEQTASKQSTYRSADDLDDGYWLEPYQDGPEENERVLSYPLHADQDGEAAFRNGYEEVRRKEPQPVQAPQEESEDEESGSDEESEADSLNDLKSDEESNDEDEQEVPKSKSVKEPEKKPSTPVKEIKELTTVQKIPFSIAMPASYEQLQSLLQEEPSKIQAIIIDRIIKTNHPKLLHPNRNKMLKLFAYLLQYTNDLFSSITEETTTKGFKVLKELSPFMFDLVQMNPNDTSQCFLEVLKEKYDDFLSNRKLFPKLETLVFLKLVGTFFSVSDFRHPVATPSFVFIQEILSEARVKTRADIASGLFLVTLVLDSQKLSKKFMPSAMTFLSTIFYLGFKKSAMEVTKPFTPLKESSSLLVLAKKFKGEFSKTMSMKYSDLIAQEIDEEFKVRALISSLNLLNDFIELYGDHVGMRYLLDVPEKFLTRLNDEPSLPAEFKECITETLNSFKEIRVTKKFVYATPEIRIQPMIRMLEPRLETVLTDRRQMFSQAEGAKLEQQKLKHMIKREFKSAQRELRRDNEYISKIRHNRIEQSDRERKAKVKRIFNEASTQQSEYKANERTKGRKSKF